MHDHLLSLSLIDAKKYLAEQMEYQRFILRICKIGLNELEKPGHQRSSDILELVSTEIGPIDPTTMSRYSASDVMADLSAWREKTGKKE